MDDDHINLVFGFPTGEEVVVNVSGFTDPMHALSALKSAGSDETLTTLVAQMREQADD